MKPRFALCAFALLALALPAGAAPFSIETLLEIKHPSDPVWSPDGRRIAFVWELAGVGNLYVADAAGNRGAPVPMTSYSQGQVTGAFWGRDGRLLYFVREGRLLAIPAAGGPPQPAWNSGAREGDIVPSPDRSRVAFVRSGAELWIRSLEDGAETRLLQGTRGLAGITWAPDGAHIAYSTGSRAIRHEETPEYSGAKIVYTTTERVPGELYVISTRGGDPAALKLPAGFGGARWIDTSHILLNRESADFKKRTILAVDIAGGEPRVLHEDIAEQFWSIPGGAGAGGQASPDGKWIAFLRDRDGWDHLYVAPAAGGEATQITRGRFETWRPVWSHDGRKIAFDANEPDRPGDRRIGIADLSDGPAHAALTWLATDRGASIAPVWSPDDRRLVYQHSDPKNSADLYVVDVAANAAPARLSDSLPPAIDRNALVEPEFVHFPGADGKSVPGWLFVPKNLDRSKKHAAVVWIHGDGINQNYDGWHVQRNYAVYYSFHQYLLQKGYVVFAPDYRGSIGYGRDWRNGVYMDVGGQDAKDAWMSATYLKTLPYVDPERIGVWGLSYGGFFTLIAVTDQPALFRAAVDVAGVVDYTMYYGDPYHGAWTASRIGTPEQNPQVYAQASPVSHIDRLARPLLVLHGTADVNVPYLQSVWLIDEALKRGKGDLVSFMMYPGEFHYFTRAHVLRDAWRRVDEFFAANLRPDVLK